MYILPRGSTALYIRNQGKVQHPAYRKRSGWKTRHLWPEAAVFGQRIALRFYPLDPPRPPLRRLEGFDVVAGVALDLAIAQLDGEQHGKYLAFAIVVDSLGDPQTLPDRRPS
jgi:hypothetical protein